MLKRPITILCISDLHLLAQRAEKDGSDINKGQLERLRHDLMRFQEESLGQIQWKPDFLLIAGDLVDKCTEENYGYVKKQIDALRKLFDIHPFKVIMTPGNHDKEVSVSSASPTDMEIIRKLYGKQEERFSNICKVGDVTPKQKECFVCDHAGAFKKFTDFYKEYAELSDNEKNIGGTFLWPDFFDGLQAPLQDLKYTSGLKVFEDEKVCFLSVNTEWMYTRRTIRPAHEQKIGICTPFVGWAFEEIRKSYPDYTVVTLMHRDPRSMSWDDRNISDLSQIDALSLIETYSDIILSGHDHTRKINPPTMLRNHAQHCGIGSVSRPAGFNENVRYTATLIHVNPIKGKMRLLTYDRWSEHQLWQFVDLGSFPLQPKYRLREYKNGANAETPEVVIRAKSSHKADIEHAIKSHLRWNEDDERRFGLLAVPCGELRRNGGELIGQLKQKISEALEKYDRVFVYFWRTTQKLWLKDNLEIEGDLLKKLKASFRFEVLKCELIVSDIIVDIPVIDLAKEYFSD